MTEPRIVVHGHLAARLRLERELPVVTLLRGPVSVGKWTLARHLVSYHRFAAADVCYYEELDRAASRAILAFASTAPFGPGKLVICRLDGATPQVLTTLLKLLEEPPPTIRFLLVAARPVLDTVLSRASLVPLGLLSQQEVYEVLHLRLGMAESQARHAASLARGQIAPALRIGEMDRPKALVLTAIKALAERDADLLAKVAESWGAEEHQLLTTWATEAATGRWRVFTEPESFGLQRTLLPRRVLSALSLDARPSLALRVGLAPLLAREA